jgi:hypothetical protein
VGLFHMAGLSTQDLDQLNPIDEFPKATAHVGGTSITPCFIRGKSRS